MNKSHRLSPFDTRSKFVEDNPEGSGISRPHTNWFQKLGVLVNKAPQIVDVPATLTSPGTPGDMAFDNGFIYGCVALNTWKKVAWM
jgi:hypothetical protein